MNDLTTKLLLPLFFLFGLYSPTSCQDSTDEVLSLEMDSLAMQLVFDSLEQTMNYQTGEIILGADIATLQVPAKFKYLNSEQSEWVLTEAWGNPPSTSLGMILPKDGKIFDSDAYAVNITFDDIGYVDDSDAKKMNFDKILKEMKKDTESGNTYRVENGYPAMEIVGWAAQPYYDQDQKKLHWAKEIAFEDYDVSTLNYDVRVLGRRGVLSLNFISDIENLSVINKDIPKLLPNVNFNAGHAYRDFDSSIDKIAAVGIGGLIAGKVLAKTGLLVLLLKFWKFLAIGAIAIFAGAKKIFSRKEV